MLVKAFLTARDLILEELRKLSRAINQNIDLTDFTSKLEDKVLFGSSPKVGWGIADAEVSGQMSNMLQNFPEVL